MQGQSQTRRLLYSIADKLGRGRRQMDPFIATLQAQWFDTRDALRALKPQDYQRLRIPQRLSNLIAEQVTNSQKMQVEPSLQGFISDLNMRLPPLHFEAAISLLSKIFQNIRMNLIDQKYRTLKKSNPKIAQLTSHQQVVNILKYGGFSQTWPGYVLTSINIGVIDECIQALDKFRPQNKFDPYKSSTVSTGTFTPTSFQGGQDSSMMWRQKLEQLQAKRQQMMSKPVKQRNIRLFQIQPQYQQMYDKSFNEQTSATQDERMYMQSVRQQLKNFGQEQTFMNKRKGEYLQLLKKPCFSETLVRVKLPNDWIFQCNFAPMETLDVLVNIFHECLVPRDLDYYLYMTPPVQKLKGVILRKTFYELGCVPRSYFHFKTEAVLSGNIFRIQPSKYREFSK